MADTDDNDSPHKELLASQHKQAHNAHDAFFKRSLHQPELAHQFFETFLPEPVLAAVDLKTLKVTEASYVDRHFKALHSDLVFTVNQQGGAQSYLYLLVEHQSTPDARMTERIIWYCIRLLEAHKRDNPQDKLPTVYPLVYYHSAPSPYPHNLDWLSAFEDPHGVMRAVFNQPLQLIDAQQQAPAVRAEHNMLGIMSLIFKGLHNPAHSSLFKDLVNRIAALLPDEQALNYLRDVAMYLNNQLSTEHMEILMETIETADMPEPNRKAFQSHADYLLIKGFDKGIEKGIKKGIEKGIEKGRQTGRAEANLETALRLGKKRFGPLPDAALAQLESASADTLERLIDSVIDAETLEQWLATEKLG